MSHNRAQRVGELLIEFLAELLVNELGDPRVRAVGLTGIDVRRDLKHATVYFNIHGEHGSVEEALSGLNQATGYMRAKIGKELRLRFVPTIAWEFDETFDRAQRIDDLLRKA